MSVAMSANYFEEPLDFMGNDADYEEWIGLVSQGIKVVVAQYKEKTGTQPHRIQVHPITSFTGGPGDGKSGFIVTTNPIEDVVV